MLAKSADSWILLIKKDDDSSCRIIDKVGKLNKSRLEAWSNQVILLNGVISSQTHAFQADTSER